MKNKLFSYFPIILVLLLAAGCGGDGTDTPPPTPGPGPGVEIEPGEGITLYGLISGPDDKPIPGVVVSDGYSVVQTDDDGVYRIVRDAKAMYVFVSVPSGYEIPVNGYTYGSYNASYRTANKTNALNSELYRQDFKLKKMDGSDDEFVIFAIGDPQPDNLDGVNFFRNETIEDIRSEVARIDKPMVALCLGDILGSNPTGDMYHRMKAAMGAAGIPVFSVIGNHDKTNGGKNPNGGNDGGLNYRQEMGPSWYSFNRGKTHFVVMDNIVLTSDGYEKGITQEQVDWLRKDLSFVPKDRMLVLSYHIPIRNSAEAGIVSVLNLVKDYANVLLLCGHTHYYQPAVNNRTGLAEHILGAACGNWWRSKVGGDGVPNGYVIYEVKGAELANSRFKATKRDAGHQLRLYRGDTDFGFGMKYSYGADYVVANVFLAGMGNKAWKLEVYEDGTYSGVMSRIEDSSSPKGQADQWIRSYHLGVLGTGEGGYDTCHHLFGYKLKNAGAKVVVKATDGFGNVYEQSEFTLAGDYAEAAGYN